MSEQSSTKVKIHQDILLRMATPGDSSSEKNSSNKKRRVTFSSFYFDEEPVFSDSEDEKEYMKRIFGEPHCMTLSKSPKNQEVGIQCDIISEKGNFIELMKKCLGIKPEVISKSSVVNKYLNQLNNLCKQIQHDLLEECGKENFEESNFSAREFSRKEHDESMISNNTYASSEEFLPSRSGNNNSLSKVIRVDELVPSKPSVCDELLIKTKKQNNSKINYHMMLDRRRSMREKKSPEKRFKMEFEPVDKKNVLKKNRAKLDESSRREAKSKNKPMPRKKSTVDKAVPGNNPNSDQTMNASLKFPKDMSKYLTNPDVHVKIQIPKKMIRPLARNWMKINKSLPLEATEVETLPRHYASLQQERQRFLYSPTKWLESDEFLNSIAQEQKNDFKTVRFSL